MKAELRYFFSFDVPDLKAWSPSENDFAIDIRLIVGPADSEGEESFDATLCTAGWLAARAREEGIVDARHHLVVDSFDYVRLANYLKRRVEECEGDSWDEIGGKVARLGYWEFEDYREEGDATRG